MKNQRIYKITVVYIKSRAGRPQEVCTYGVPSQIPGLSVTIDYASELDRKKRQYKITHIGSGSSLPGIEYFSMAAANRVIAEFFSGLDWTLPEIEINKSKKHEAACKEAFDAQREE